MGKHHSVNDVNNFINREIANSTPVGTLKDLQDKKMVNDETAYIFADPFTGNPNELLGQVVEIRKSSNGECSADLKNGKDLNFEFSTFPVSGFKIDEKTELSKPVLRGSIIVDKNLTTEVGFLSFLNAQLDQKSCFSLMIMDQAKGLIDTHDNSWKEAVKTWINDNEAKMKDPDICFIYVVTGYIQKNIIKKKYYQFETGAKGGAYGININGKLSTSNDEYSLDIVFGLSPSIIKRPMPIQQVETPSSKGLIADLNTEATVEERKLFASMTGAILNEDFIVKQKNYKPIIQEILQE